MNKTNSDDTGTNRNLELVEFPTVKRRRVQAAFDGGNTSSDAGLLLLRQVDRKTGFLRAVAKALPDSRDPERIEHSVEALLAQRVYGLCLGYEDLNDHDTLRDFLSEHLARFEVPRYITVVNTPLPRTASGKILKRELRDEAVKQLTGVT